MINSYQRARLLLCIATGVSFIMAWAVSSVLQLPPERGYAMTLFSHPAALPVILGTMLAATLIATLIAGTIRFDAGLAGAAAAVAAFSMRGGPARTLLMSSASGSRAYTMMAIETLVLYAMLGLCWALLWQLHRRGWLRRDATRDGMPEPVDPPSNRLLSFAITVVVTAILVYLLARTDDKKQVMGAVFCAAFLGTAAAHYQQPVSPSVFYWLAPGAVAIIGYLWASSAPGPWMIGEIPQPLARALPMDYVSAGTLGAVVGYWMSRRWHRGRLESEAAEAAAT